MIKEEENKKTEETEEVVEIEDVDVGLKEEDVKVVKKENERKVKEQHVLNKEQQSIFEQIMVAAKMPVKLENKDFKLGENELDIRYLSKQNKEQMFFRELALLNIYAKECFTTLIDVTRLLMVIADKLGVPDIIKATDEVIEKVEKANKIKEKLGKKQ